MHAKDDDVIPFSHSDNLFEGLVDTALGSSLDERPTTSSADAAKDEATALAKYGAHRRGLRSKLVKERTVDGFATILDFSFARTDASAAAGESDEQGSVMFVRTVHGGHNRVGEGVIDLIGDVLNIGRVKWQGTVRA